MSRTSLVLPLLLPILSGCTIHYVWERGGATADEVRRDNYECNRDAAMPPMQGSFTALLRRNMYEDCMKARGYEMKSKLWWGYL